MRRVCAFILATALLGAVPATAQGRFNWDKLGAEFCRLSLAGDLDGMRDILSPSLMAEIEAASRNPELLRPNVLFQSYMNEVSLCRAETRNAALVAITRSNPGGASPSWTEYLVVAPEPDGTTRIDDVLFATRRSDTLRARLDYYMTTR